MNPKLHFHDVHVDIDENNNRCYSSDNIVCDLCNEISRDELTIPNITSPCCYSPVCPKCVTVNDKDASFNYLLIKNVIYIQYDPKEKDPISKEEMEGNDDIQYRWAFYKPYDETTLDNYKIVNKKYNRFGVQNFETDGDDEDDYYQDISCLCECKVCGFKCAARIYMDS